MPVLACMSFTLPPAQNALPAPVRITHFTDTSAWMRSAASTNEAHWSGVDSALREAGSFSVRVTIAPVCS